MTEPFIPVSASRASKEWRNPASQIARNARWFAFYVTLTVNGRRARADRVATVLRDLEEQPRLQR